MYLLASCLVWLVTATLVDDQLQWDPVEDPDLTHYEVMWIDSEVMAWVDVGLDLEARPPFEAFDGTACVRACAMGGCSVGRCIEWLGEDWDGTQVDRFMQWTTPCNISTGEGCPEPGCGTRPQMEINPNDDEWTRRE